VQLSNTPDVRGTAQLVRSSAGPSSEGSRPAFYNRQAVLFSALADFVVLIHLGFIVFVVFGGLLALRWPRSAWLHVPAVAWGVYIEISGGICPLTPLENVLREAAGARTYQGSFVEHYLVPIIYPPALTRDMQFVLAGGAVGVNAAAYALVWLRARRPKDHGQEARGTRLAEGSGRLAGQSDQADGVDREDP
jgi:hypothetical protein